MSTSHLLAKVRSRSSAEVPSSAPASALPVSTSSRRITYVPSL